MKMAKKVFAVLLSVLFVVGVFTACSSNSGDTKKKEDTTNSATSKLKVGFIFLHDKNSTYDLNFIKAADAACKKLGITGAQKLYKTQIPEGQEAYDAAVDLAEQGCNIIFADSFGTSLTSLRLPRSTPMCSSATPPAPELTPRVWPTTTTLLPPSMRAVTWQVLPPV